MSGSDLKGEVFSRLFQFLAAAGAAYQAGPAGLAESYAKASTRDGIDHRLVKILDRFYEMALPEDYVRVLGRAKLDQP